MLMNKRTIEYGNINLPDVVSIDGFSLETADDSPSVTYGFTKQVKKELE